MLHVCRCAWGATGTNYPQHVNVALSTQQRLAVDDPSSPAPCHRSAAALSHPSLQPQARPVNSTTTFLSNAGKRNALPHGPNRTSITVRQVDGVPLHSLSLAYREYVPRSIGTGPPALMQLILSLHFYLHDGDCDCEYGERMQERRACELAGRVLRCFSQQTSQRATLHAGVRSLHR